ncbi:uncharacterized protein N7506_001903 [Penicillium brevicompactum]|uniref:uncharacterized protein n=1 Tax=Penicillium brevicompactum TaxID=5074 RepID=UPI0025420785|nr:uncharacterized protein N7506_001903 [Penicillium brevicompactum]KAJ5348650.1 hypothetical protein N7506_001903 [Penicillium brevicompactum]
MPPSEAEVLSALILLRDTPNELINSHRGVALQTLEQIRQALNKERIEDETCQNSVDAENTRGSVRDVDIAEARVSQKVDSTRTTNPSPPTQMNNPLSLLACGISKPLSNATKKRKRQVINDPLSVTIIKSVKEKLSLIREFCKSRASLSEILQTEQEIQFADKRIDHLKQIDGNKNPSEEQKLLKGLSQLSLAQQFMNWETERGWKTRANVLYDQIQENGAKGPSDSKRPARNMTRFVRDHGYPEPDQNVVRKGIQRGTNQLLFLKVLKSSSTSPAQKEAVRGMLAPITIFEYALFQKIGVSELPMLAQSVLQEHEQSGFLPEGQSNEAITLLESAQLISPWFENMNGDFEMISRIDARGPRDLRPPVKPTASNVASGHADSDTHLPFPNYSSEDGISNCLSNSADYPSMNSHELTTFSTFPSAESSTQRRPSDASFIPPQGVPEEVEIFQNTGSHDLAQIARSTSDINRGLTRNSDSYRMPHDISSFCTPPSALIQQPFQRPEIRNTLRADLHVRCTYFQGRRNQRDSEKCDNSQ